MSNLLLSLEFLQNAADFVSFTPVGRPVPTKKMPFIAILTKTIIVMQMFSKKASIFAHKETNASLTKKLLHVFSILLSTSFAKLCLIVSHSVVLNDIMKVVRFQITESRGIKFKLRQSGTKTVRHI